MNGNRGMSNSKNCWNLSLHGHRNVAARPVYLYTALGWGYSSSPRRKRREVKRRDARVPVPVPDQSLLIPFDDPHHLDARRWLPDSTESTSVKVEGLARVAVPEVHPLEGVRQGRAFQLSSRRGWAATGGHSRTRVRSQLRTFF